MKNCVLFETDASLFFSSRFFSSWFCVLVFFFLRSYFCFVPCFGSGSSLRRTVCSFYRLVMNVRWSFSMWSIEEVRFTHITHSMCNNIALQWNERTNDRTTETNGWNIHFRIFNPTRENLQRFWLVILKSCAFKFYSHFFFFAIVVVCASSVSLSSPSSSSFVWWIVSTSGYLMRVRSISSQV